MDPAMHKCDLDIYLKLSWPSSRSNSRNTYDSTRNIIILISGLTYKLYKAMHFLNFSKLKKKWSSKKLKVTEIENTKDMLPMIYWWQPSTKYFFQVCPQDSNFGQYINMLKYVRATCMHDTRPPLDRARQITFILVIPYERAWKAGHIIWKTWSRHAYWMQIINILTLKKISGEN